jgi:putative endonuclease
MATSKWLGCKSYQEAITCKVYAEHYDHVADAFYREKQVQGWSRAKKIALMNSDWDRLHVLAECQNYSHHENALRLRSGQAAQPADEIEPAED